MTFVFKPIYVIFQIKLNFESCTTYISIVSYPFLTHGDHLGARIGQRVVDEEKGSREEKKEPEIQASTRQEVGICILFCKQ